ncbi:hypothetical protein AOX59_16370 [Lentibacillus amyloliquefaciens]|uniref:Transposase n=2 Tax=Lentibacillus amyloliquefaciens TaxID=1472767 RepID=A0A0U3WJJ1_9BACI|nr:hypothetical protein AOX59_16370 [Lentibacillus amyloliquefaciens]
MSKMEYTEDEKIEVKKEFLRMLVRLELDPARNRELTTFFETYLKLTDEEEYILQEEVRHLNPDEEAKVMELMTSYERKGIEKGIKKVAINLLSDGMDVPKVAELTGLSEKEITELKNQQDRND